MNIPIRTDATTIYDALSGAEKDALTLVDAIHEQIIRKLYVRSAQHGRRIDPREISSDAREAARERADAILLCLIGLTQEDEDIVARKPAL